MLQSDVSSPVFIQWDDNKHEVIVEKVTVCATSSICEAILCLFYLITSSTFSMNSSRFFCCLSRFFFSALMIMTASCQQNYGRLSEKLPRCLSALPDTWTCYVTGLMTVCACHESMVQFLVFTRQFVYYQPTWLFFRLLIQTYLHTCCISVLCLSFMFSRIIGVLIK